MGGVLMTRPYGPLVAGTKKTTRPHEKLRNPNPSAKQKKTNKKISMCGGKKKKKGWWKKKKKCGLNHSLPKGTEWKGKESSPLRLT